MQLWQKIIVQTVQLGGSLIFIKDQAPVDFEDWVLTLANTCKHQVPFSVRTVADLKSGKIFSKSEDLYLFFPTQKNELSELNQYILGQRLFLHSTLEALPADYAFPISLSEWQQFCASNVWEQSLLHPAESFGKRAPCLFLDRDDVIVFNVPYNKDPSQVKLRPGITDLINSAHAKGYWVAMVTNQSGLGRGRISWQEYQAVHQQMLKLLAAEGAWIDESEWASYIESANHPVGELFAGLRKPRNGMFLKVQSKLKADLAKSIMIGDSATDLVAADSAGLKNLFLLSSDKFVEEKKTLEGFQKTNSNFSFQTLNNLTEALTKL